MPVIKVRDKNGIVKSVPGIKVFVEGGGQGGSEPKLQDKTITENGTYSADDGYDGLGEVTVDVGGGVGVSASSKITIPTYEGTSVSIGANVSASYTFTIE